MFLKQHVVASLGKQRQVHGRPSGRCKTAPPGFLRREEWIRAGSPSAPPSRVPHPLLLALVCAPLSWLPAALAGAEPDPPLPAQQAPDSQADPGNDAPPGDVFPFVLRILDPGGHLKGRQPRVILDNGITTRTLLPRDDGQPPDTQAGDGSYALGVADFPGSSFDIRLEAGEGDDAFQSEGHVAFSPDNLERNLVVLVEQDGAAFGTNDNELSLRPGGGEVQERAGPAGRAPGSGRETTGGGSPWGSLVWAWLLGMAGGFLGAFFYHARGVFRGGKGLVRIGRGRPMRPLGDTLPDTETPSLWTAPGPDLPDLIAILAQRLTSRGAVLLIPAPEHRERLVSLFGPTPYPVWIPAQDRPSPATVVAGARMLEAMGLLVTLVVEGVDALEEAHPDTPFAALEDLVTAADRPICIVMETGSPVPVDSWTLVQVRRDGTGRLVTEQGTPLDPLKPVHG